MKSFLWEVNEKEQPFGRIYDLVHDIRRHCGIVVNLYINVDVCFKFEPDFWPQYSSLDAITTFN